MARRSSPSTQGIVWTLTVCTALSLAGDGTLYAVLPSQHAALGLAALQVGWLLSVNRLARIPLNALSGWLSNRVGFRAPYVAGLLCGALSTIGYGLTESYGLLLALRALWGLSWALLTVAALGMILDAAAPDERGHYTGVYSSFSFFGGAILTILGGAWVDRLGYAPAMRLLGTITALGLLVSLTLPSRRARPVTISRRGRAVRGTGWAQRMGVGHPQILLVLVMNFFHRFFFAGVFYATFGAYLAATLGQHPIVGGHTLGVASLTAALLFLRNVVSILVGPLLGRLSDRLGQRAGLIAIGFGLGAIGLGLLALPHTWPTLVIAVVASAIAYGLVPPLMVARIGDLTQGHRGGAISGYQIAGDLGSGLGPLAAYALIDSVGMSTTYGLCGALLFGLVILALAGLRQHARTQNVPLDA